ncbi:hypothetical protein QOZ80_5AG0375770 [Eleusine coracana subsp. coracana]|nr:hypothetical protein QOZ80_5AG0375770 [Eleusine coracana subsp. coracana]
MASRILARSKALALAAALSRAGADAAQPLDGARALSSIPRYSAAAGSPLGLGKVLGYEPRSHLSGTQVLPRWFSTVPSNGSPTQKSQISETYKSGTAVEQSDAQKSKDGDTPKVVAFSPVEAAIAKPRSGPLTMFHQVYMFHKEIFLDYVHHDISRKWALIYFKILLLIMAKDTLICFDLV